MLTGYDRRIIAMMFRLIMDAILVAIHFTIYGVDRKDAEGMNNKIQGNYDALLAHLDEWKDSGVY